MKVNTPQPSLKSRYEPKEMRAQKGIYQALDFEDKYIWQGVKQAYYRNNFILNLLRERDDFHIDCEVDLLQH